MINKDGLAKMLRDLRVLDFLKVNLNISIEDDSILCIESFAGDDCEYECISLDIPDYIKDDLYEWVADDEI